MCSLSFKGKMENRRPPFDIIHNPSGGPRRKYQLRGSKRWRGKNDEHMFLAGAGGGRQSFLRYATSSQKQWSRQELTTRERKREAKGHNHREYHSLRQTALEIDEHDVCEEHCLVLCTPSTGSSAEIGCRHASRPGFHIQVAEFTSCIVQSYVQEKTQKKIESPALWNLVRT